jgi:hypothetical protein
MGLKLEVGDNVRVAKGSGQPDNIIGHSGSIERGVLPRGKGSAGLLLVKCRTCDQVHDLPEEALVHEAEIWIKEMESTLDDVARMVRNGGLKLVATSGTSRFEFISSHSVKRAFSLKLERVKK